MSGSANATARNRHRTVAALLAVVAASFAFGFALVPLYDVLCEITGLNGKTGGRGTMAFAAAPADQRALTVEFTDTVMPGLPWEIVAPPARLEVHPGEMHEVRYRVRNLSDQTVVAQAVPSVSPGSAAASFTKLECFCFSQQSLAPGESKELPLAFVVKPDIGNDVRTITLAYAFFNVGAASPQQQGERP